MKVKVAFKKDASLEFLNLRFCLYLPLCFDSEIC